MHWGMREGELQWRSLLRRSRRKARVCCGVRNSGMGMVMFDDDDVVVVEESLSSAEESIRT